MIKSNCAKTAKFSNMNFYKKPNYLLTLITLLTIISILMTPIYSMETKKYFETLNDLIEYYRREKSNLPKKLKSEKLKVFK